MNPISPRPFTPTLRAIIIVVKNPRALESSSAEDKREKFFAALFIDEIL
jgi:hypothetical protein